MHTFGYYALCHEGNIYYLDIFIINGNKNKCQVQDRMMDFHRHIYQNHKNSELNSKIKDIDICEIDILEIYYDKKYSKKYIHNMIIPAVECYRESYGQLGYKNTGANMRDPFSFYEIYNMLDNM
jgi:hypothetical protein